jgi:xylulokinase
MRQAVLGIDVGTSSLKAGLLTVRGEVLGRVERIAYKLSSPEPGAGEQDPEDWWRALVAACQRLLPAVERDVHLLALAVGGQAPVLCATDADLVPTYPALSWLDQRSAVEAERLYSRLGRPVPPWGSWPAQAAWLVRHRPEALPRTRWLFGCPDYVAARLTGRPVSFLAWPPDELEAAGIDQAVMPPEVAPGEVVGPISSSAAKATGLPTGTPVVAGFVDGILGVLGSGVQQQGDACMNGGTSGTVSMVSPRGVGYPVLDLWVHGAATNTSGKALDWFAESFARGVSYPDLLATAGQVPPGAGGLLFLPHLAGERASAADSRSRGAWVGLTLEHDRRHLLRSLLEGVAFSFRTLAESLAEQAGALGEVYAVGGQAHSELWNQIKADVLQRPLLVPRVVEGAVVGAAILAALGVGTFADRASAVAAMVHVARRFEPDAERAARYDDLFGAYSALTTALRETSRRLRGLTPERG